VDVSLEIQVPALATPIAALLITITSLLVLVAVDWRVSIGALALQYLAVFVLITAEWPFSMAITILIAGWIAGAVLGMGMLSLPDVSSQAPASGSGSEIEGTTQRRQPSAFTMPRATMSPWFYSLAAILAWLAALSQMPSVVAIIPGIQFSQAWGGLVLVFTGLLKLAYATLTLHRILGLLTALAGFEILLAPLDAGPATAGLSAALVLTISFIGAYMLVAPYMQENE
jgi:hypothetical protein